MPADVETDAQRQAREDERDYGRRYDEFAGRYWHCTSWRGLRSVMADGAIIPNVGQYRFSSGATACSYAYRESRISIFDFAAPSRASALAQAWAWQPFLYIWRPITVVLQLSADWVERRIVRAAEVRESFEPGIKALRIPAVEAWVRDPVPFSIVTAAHVYATGQSPLPVEPPLTLDRLEAARVDITQRARLARRLASPDGGFDLQVRLADREIRRQRRG